MSPVSIFNNIIDIYRYNSILYQGEITEVSVDTTLSDEALIRVSLDAEQSGSIYLNGSTIETLIFDDSRYGESNNLFTMVSGVTIVPSQSNVTSPPPARAVSSVAQSQTLTVPAAWAACGETKLKTGKMNKHSASKMRLEYRNVEDIPVFS